MLRVLFYGQSITSTSWTDRSTEYLQRRYPHTSIVTKNLAIGGNSAIDLERAAARDVEDFYPDLIVFHVYGDHRAYERIVRIFRTLTAAEVIVQTDHVRSPVEPQCPEGLNITGSTPPGCTGTFWLRQRYWDDHMSGRVIPALAVKYRLAVDPRRERWSEYLKHNGLKPKQLLRDGLHPNEDGWRLAAALFDTYFDNVIRLSPASGQRLVQSLHAPDADDTLYSVTGNRIELISGEALSQLPVAQLDGRMSASIDGCWQVSRVSPVPTVPEWPAIRQVYVDRSAHKETQWTAAIEGEDFSTNKFRFKVRNSRLGSDGEGSGEDSFYSSNGEAAIESRDWALSRAAVTAKMKLPDKFEVAWSLRYKCVLQPPIRLTNGAYEFRYLLASGLENADHELRLHISSVDRAKIRELRVYRPPLPKTYTAIWY